MINLAYIPMLVAQCVHVAAHLRLADLLAKGPRHVDDLAREAGSHPEALFRLMCTLESMGVFAREGERSFRNTQLGESLRSDVPGSARGWAVFMGSEWMWNTMGKMLGTVKSGVNYFDDQLKTPFFRWIEQYPEFAQQFNNGMATMSDVMSSMVVNALDLSGVGSLADIGGGNGTLLSAILRANPGLRGTLFDQPQVVEVALSEGPLHGIERADRCQFVAGDFFKKQPAGMDAYLMKWILHDWSDEQVKQILSATREAAGGPGKKLFIVELVIDPVPQKALNARLIDLIMMIFLEGRERTEEDFRRLLSSAGFELTRVVPTHTPYSVLQAVSV